MINLEKSVLYLHKKVPMGVSNQIKRIKGVRQVSFPFMHRGGPVFHERKNKGHFEELIKKVMKDLVFGRINYCFLEEDTF